jgi:Cof subfamily protein (haloacid dehalogenase superfamily)
VFEVSDPIALYDIAFCDLDGTISTYDRKVRPAVLEAMKDVIAAGKWITVCTGRGYQTLSPFLEQVPVNAPLILCNGALIVEPSSRKVLEFHPMPLRLVHGLMHLALQEELELWIYLDDLETMVQHKPSSHYFTLERPGKASQDVPDPYRLVSRSPHKVAFLAERQADTQRVVEILERCVEGSARIVISSPRVLEVIMPGISKAQAIARVAAMLGVEQDKTLAVGDGDNDVEMISWAGKGIAMGNATPLAVKAAEWVAPSIDQDGLAVVLRKFMIPALTLR